MAEKKISQLVVPASSDIYTIDAEYIKGKEPSTFVKDISPTKTGGGASGTWGINISGKAGSVDWVNTGHPSTFPPSSHTHSYLPLSGGTLTGNLTGQYLTGTWLRTTAATNLGGAATKIAVLRASDGYIYYRTPSEIKSDIGLNNVDNKSSATIRKEITSLNVTTALGYTPLSATSIIDGGTW